MTAIRNQRGGVRRGISIAAAALSLALVAPAIQPAGPISTGVVAQAEPALPTLFNPGVKTPKQVSSQGTEYYISDAEKAGAYESVDGYAYIDVTGWPSGLDAYDVPLEGKVVFAQWKDYAPAKDGNGRISPVYASTVKPDGSWAIKFPVWTDEKGQEHNWEATAGQYLRVWIEDYDTEKYQLGFAEYLGQWTGAAQRQKAAWGGLAARNAGPYNIGLQERPQSWLTQPEDQWVKSTDIQDYGNTSGRIFRENEIGFATSGGVTTFKGTDVALPNEKIVGSYLRDELKTQLDEWKAANKGFKYDELVAEQKRAIKAWDADPANAGKPAIAETVWTTSDKDGKYKLQFKGIFNKTHELAKSPSDGVFIAGSAEGKKHVNTDYMYVYPALTVSDGSTSTSENGANMRTMGGAYFSDIASPGALATIGVAGRSNPINVLFAVNNGFPKFDILEYNTTDKPARAGTTVTAKTTSFKSEMPYRIEWYVGDKMVDKVQGTTDRYGNLQDHTFTVPEGTPDNTIVSARIYRTTEKEGSANFDAVDEFRVASQPEVIEDPVEGIEGKPITPVEVVKDIPEGGSVDAPKLPAGLSIDENGKLNGTPEKLTDWGKDEESRVIQVPVSIKDKDGKEVATGTIPVTILRDTDGDGIPDTKDDDDDNDGFTDEQEKEAGTDPKDANSKPAEAPAPTITDSPVKGTEGQPITPVEVVKNAPKDGSIEAKGLPKGLTIGKDGKVTGTPEKLTDWGKDEESRDIPVEVTVKDKDGKVVATKTVTVTIERDTDGDGTPDVTDTDDDGDGYTDEQEKKAGTDPKDPNSKPAEAPAPTITDSPVKGTEGQPITPVEVVKNAPKDGSIEAKGLPKGLTIGKDGKVTGTPEKLTDWGKDEESRDIPVEVTVKDKDGKVVATKTVTVTIERDTDGDGTPDVTDTDDDGDGYTDEQEKKAGTDPKDPNSKPAEAPAPTVSKTPVKAVEGQKLAPVEVVKDAPKDGSIEAKGLPKGLTIGKDGKLSGTPDKITDWKKGEEERTIPVEVVVKDKDGKEIAKGTVNVTIQRDTDGDGIPDVTDTDDDGDGYTDEQEKKAGTDPKDANDKPAQDTTGVQPGANDSVPADGKEKPITGKVTGPTEGVTGTLVDKDGKAVPGAKVTIDKDGTVKVTVPEGTKPGSYNVEVKKGDKKIGDLPITITKPGTSEGSIPGLTEDQANKCVGASAASAIPLLLLTPIALGLAMDNQQVKDLTAGFGQQLEDINTGIQKTLGIYNPELAQQFKVQVAPHLQNLVLAAGFVASIALLAGVAATQCVPGGGSSDNTSAQK